LEGGQLLLDFWDSQKIHRACRGPRQQQIRDSGNDNGHPYSDLYMVR